MTLPCSEAQRTLQKPPFHPLQSADEQPEAAGRLGKRSQTFQVSVQGSFQHPDHLSRTLYDSLSRLGCPQASIYLLHHPTSHTHNSLPPPHTHRHTHTPPSPPPLSPAPYLLSSLFLSPSPTFSSYQEAPGKQIAFGVLHLWGPPWSSTCTSKEPGQPPALLATQ